MIPGETLANGASPTCSDCKETPKLGVYHSAAGWYIGTYCGCGPYSRESDYFKKREQANKAFETGNYERS